MEIYDPEAVVPLIVIEVQNGINVRNCFLGERSLKSSVILMRVIVFANSNLVPCAEMDILGVLFSFIQD